ncbi:hypothetical protein ACI2K4_19945 [Micromonospora sp. NPDC050397]|uniref:hypothetical protein n=1 Tax=Micromonospora sp. NPDC050397 TaxID=3364279 RepID=UPI00384C41B5
MPAPNNRNSPCRRVNATLPGMAVRGWGGSVAIAIGVAAGAGAAQLGLGYGLGIIAWLPSASGTSEATWVASLAWAAWIAATSTVAGAIAAQRIGAPETVRPTASGGAVKSGQTLTTGLWRVALALASAVGGLVTVALVAVPARAATRADSVSPQSIAAGYAVIGVMLGLVMAIWSLSSPAVASNVIATSAWLWLLAIVAVVDGVLSGRGLASAQLGVWQITSDSERFWFRDYFYWPGAALSLGSALVIGALAARSTARSPERRVGAVVSGVAGPLLVAAAYFLAAPRLAGIRAEQVSAHLAAPYAVIAGLAGSALVAAMAQRRSTNRDLQRPVLTGPDSPTQQGRSDSWTQQGGSDSSAQPEQGTAPTQRTAGRIDTADDESQPSTRPYGDKPVSRPAGGPASPATGPARSPSGDSEPERRDAAWTADSLPDRTETVVGADQPTGAGTDAEQPEPSSKPKGRTPRFGRRSR